ncbi:MAG TPA: hypothetical protein VGA36_08840, partial [Nitriliruptorales bacterium]
MFDDDTSRLVLTRVGNDRRRGASKATHGVDGCSFPVGAFALMAAAQQDRVRAFDAPQHHRLLVCRPLGPAKAP